MSQGRGADITHSITLPSDLSTDDIGTIFCIPRPNNLDYIQDTYVSKSTSLLNVPVIGSLSNLDLHRLTVCRIGSLCGIMYKLQRKLWGSVL